MTEIRCFNCDAPVDHEQEHLVTRVPLGEDCRCSKIHHCICDQLVWGCLRAPLVVTIHLHQPNLSNELEQSAPRQY